VHSGLDRVHYFGGAIGSSLDLMFQLAIHGSRDCVADGLEGAVKRIGIEMGVAVIEA
jgi:hypothetical protein